MIMYIKSRTLLSEKRLTFRFALFDTYALETCTLGPKLRKEPKEPPYGELKPQETTILSL